MVLILDAQLFLFFSFHSLPLIKHERKLKHADNANDSKQVRQTSNLEDKRYRVCYLISPKNCLQQRVDRAISIGTDSLKRRALMGLRTIAAMRTKTPHEASQVAGNKVPRRWQAPVQVINNVPKKTQQTFIDQR